MRLPTAGTWLALCGLLLPPPARGDDLAAELARLTNTSAYRNARWGLLIVEADTGKVVYEQNADQLFAPASVTKLYSCAAALVGLGGDRRYETPVYRRGTLQDGRLAGDLILVGQGDLTLGGRNRPDGKLAFKDLDHTYANPQSIRNEVTESDPLAGLLDLADQVKKAGITAIDGDVLVDERLFVPARATGSGPRQISPVLVNDDILDLLIRPGEKVGDPVRVRCHPATSWMSIEVRATTVESGKSLNVRAEHAGPYVLRVIGQVPLGTPEVVRIYAFDDPGAYARALFIEALRARGVEVPANPRMPPKVALPASEEVARLPRVAVLISPPLSETVKVTLKVSHNLYASTLPLLLAVADGKRTLPDGLARQGKILRDLGVDVNTISLESGAGGAEGDKVSPRATVQLLRAMRNRPDFPVFKAALPVLGVDGTVADAVSQDSPAKGKVWAKTGTYTDTDLLNQRLLLRSKALAGYLTTATGKDLVFCFFVNDVALPPGIEPVREGKVLGRLAEATVLHAP
jgi:D-alanyl-D-alanine carboxypeptidase/D-alanyl-D-alanine-endopeptidase (penicillin-binding protein 4)